MYAHYSEHLVRKGPVSPPISLPAYSRLPAELKLEILKHYTAELREPNFAESSIWDWVLLALQAFTHHSNIQDICFHPTALDLVYLHFPLEAKIFPLHWFRNHRVKVPKYLQTEHFFSEDPFRFHIDNVDAWCERCRLAS